MLHHTHAGCYCLYDNQAFVHGLFDKDAAHFVMNPFFRDHTSYGAILAMLFFALGGLVLNKKRDLLIQMMLLGNLDPDYHGIDFVIHPGCLD